MLEWEAPLEVTLYDKLNFDLIRDIAPVASIHREPNVLERLGGRPGLFLSRLRRGASRAA